ncbi:AraC-like DNA-binding protein [Spinactinospora alkalitolerans]|uniref:AraC-like DNA-binding protein n=1 Tax=Spinactinospora alkalitolerans TaxID=687207 RepID=A0A852TX59_9ACTN|nr:AraC family transcriptional regulator [Spinactinospora alkalitolerans]NYE48599.1 AraC-like DNA-binding protein [Spinactinospora alkalitolerans]
MTPIDEESEDRPRYWRHPGLPDVELMRARFVRHTFNRHIHETYTIGLIEAGIEEYAYRGETQRVGRGGLALVEPHEVHTGHAGVPEGWRYRVMYPSVELVSAVAAEIGVPGPPAFRTSVLDDPATADLLRRAHLATEQGDRLSASSLTRRGLARLLQRHARTAPGLRPAGGSPGAVSEARDILQVRLVDPPSLEELAAAVGATPFALLRAFRAAYGLPPHAYLNQLRVHEARALLGSGRSPADVAALVGFADQSHLTRHFKRHLGLPPGAYRRDVLPGNSADLERES